MTQAGLAAHAVRRACEEVLSRACRPGDRLVVGVSGGADSLALAAALGGETSGRWQPTAVIVDHQLQPGSAEVAEEARAKCARVGVVDAMVVRVEVENAGEGLEAAARNARQFALQRVANEIGASAVLLAHTMDDQAETVLLRLTRGSGTRSLAGMRIVAPQPGSAKPLIRPLLTLGRDQVRASLTHFGLSAHEDPHNVDPRFLRSQVRHEVLPVLLDVLGPGVVPSLVRTAELARMDADALDAIAANVLALATTPDGLDIEVLKSEPPAIATRVVRSWLLGFSDGAALGFGHVMAVTRLALDRAISGPVALPGIEVSRESGRLRASRRIDGRESTLG